MARAPLTSANDPIADIAHRTVRCSKHGMIEPELARMTIEIIALGVISTTVASYVSRRQSPFRGVVFGSLTAAFLWMVILIIEIGFFARWH